MCALCRTTGSVLGVTIIDADGNLATRWICRGCADRVRDAITDSDVRHITASWPGQPDIPPW